MRQRKLFFVVVALLLLGISLPVTAQRFTASIRGAVTDAEGSPVGGALVTVSNVDTGLTRSTTTNAAGSYSIGDLPVGFYFLEVELEGFRSAVVTNIELNVADTREINAQLTEGEVEDEITVTSSAIVVETIGGEVAGLVTGEQVRELPLNGRNFMQLAFLMPGVAASESYNTKNKGLLTSADLSVSGGMTTSNMWTVDGANNNDVGSNRTILVYPSLEAIEEFKIHRNSYGAEFGGAGGAQVNLVTRGGTNELKGSVYLFQRRDSWNETNAILKEAGQPKSPLERDDYGYTFGGPIKKDRVHFFLSQEWNDEVRGIPRNDRVPTAAEKQGDFSQTNTDCHSIPVDPLTGLPFPGNVIPPDRLSEAGLNWLQLYSDANISDPSNCFNWVTSVVTPIDFEQINARLDWTVNDKHRVLVRYTDDEWGNPGPTAGDANGLWGDDAFPSIDSNWQQPSESMVAQLNSVIGTSAINTLTYSQSGNEIHITAADQDPQLRAALVGTIPPFFPGSEKTSQGQGHMVTWGGANLGSLWVASPWFNDQDVDLYKDDYEQVFGKHVMKAGISYSENHKLEPLDVASPEQGVLGGWGPWPGLASGYVGNDWGGNSGNPIADLLLEDMVFGFSENSRSVRGDAKWEDLEVYLADSWKAMPNLTLDYGVRYSLYQEPYGANPEEFLNFNPDRFDPTFGNSKCNGLMQVPGTDPCGAAGLAGATDGPNKALINEDTDNFAPRLGLAWDMKGNGESVLRVGLGQFFQRDRVSTHLGLPNNAPDVQSVAGLRTLDGRFFGASPAGRPLHGWDINRDTPYMVQYNVAWEQALGRNSSIEVAYVGSRGRHLVRSQQISFVREGDFNGNGISDRLEYTRCSDNPCQASFHQFGIYGDGSITYWTDNGASEYDSIQTQYIARYGRGSQFQASYTWGDFQANADVNGADSGLNRDSTQTDPANPQLDWGRAELDREHLFNASLIHNLPVFEGEGGFKERFLGNWSVGGIVTYNSGQPLTVFTGDWDGLFETGGGGTGYTDAQRPIRVAGVSCNGSGGRNVLNPDAFTLDGYRLGEVSQMAPRGVCEGDEFFQIDMFLYKNIPIGDRFNAQFRIEIFNLFDEVNWFGVDLDWDDATTYDAAMTVVESSTANSNFGIANSARDAREIQLGLKVSF
jgi:hypothetical protein